MNIEQVSEKKDNLRAYLKALTELEEGWDGYSGVAASNESYLGSLSFLDKFLSFNQEQQYSLIFPQAMLASDGEISLYWEKDNNYLEIILTDNNSYYYFYDSIDNSFGEDDLKIDNGLTLKIKESLLQYFQTNNSQA